MIKRERSFCQISTRVNLNYLLEVFMITRENILNLAEKEHDICISIYLRTHKTGESVQQDPIRLKNLLGEASEMLKKQGLKDREIEALLEEPRKLLDTPLFWQHNDQGLALFMSEDEFEYYRIPHSFNERVMVDDHYLITPLVPMITLEGTFSILTLSQKEVRLLRSTRTKVIRLTLEEAPTNMKEYLKFNVQEPSLQHHAGQATGGEHGKGDIFHGHGGEGSTDQREAINYLKHIENEVTSKMRQRNDPLILAGMEKAVAEYRKINHYNRVMDDAITQNPDDLKDEELKDKGWEIIQSHFLQGMYNDIERFGDLAGSEKQSDNLSKIIEAAYYGRVESLFVPIGEHSWGRFDEERDTVHHSSEQRNGEHDLINMAAIKTLTQSGNVYALDKEDMPNNSSIAAIFRYST